MKRILAGGLSAVLLITGIAVAPALSQTAGDPEAGADTFDSFCGDCHSVSPKSINKKGPSLYHVIGRHAGTQPGFAYSANMHNSGIVWTPDKIAAYLENPKAVVPNGIMKFRGLPNPRDRANVIAYLRNPD